MDSDSFCSKTDSLMGKNSEQYSIQFFSTNDEVDKRGISGVSRCS